MLIQNGAARGITVDKRLDAGRIDAEPRARQASHRFDVARAGSRQIECVARVVVDADEERAAFGGGGVRARERPQASPDKNANLSKSRRKTLALGQTPGGRLLRITKSPSNMNGGEHRQPKRSPYPPV